MATQSGANEAKRPDPNEKLVKVFDTEVESEAMVVKGLLDSAGIDSDLMSGSLVQDTFPGLGGMVILARAEDAEAARRLIAESRSASLPDLTGDSSGGKGAVDDDATAELPTQE
jgi:hypothetical protein